MLTAGVCLLTGGLIFGLPLEEPALLYLVLIYTLIMYELPESVHKQMVVLTIPLHLYPLNRVMFLRQ